MKPATNSRSCYAGRILRVDLTWEKIGEEGILALQNHEEAVI